MTEIIQILNRCDFGRDASLDSLLIQMQFPRNLKNIVPKKKYLLAVLRDERGSIETVESDTNAFESERDFTGQQLMFNEWNSERRAEVVPLYHCTSPITGGEKSAEYTCLPAEVAELFSQGTLRTHPGESTEYSALMMVAPNKGRKPDEGRTGILLKNAVPVIVTVEGKEYLVELKGIGRPDGKYDANTTLSRTVSGQSGEMVYGDLAAMDAAKEFYCFERAVQGNISAFIEGESPRAVGYISQRMGGYENSVLIRLTPSSVRSSFNHNPDMPQLRDRNDTLATDIGREWAQLAKLKKVLLHENIHPENMVFTGTSYVLTDFADVECLESVVEEEGSAKEYIKRVLSKISEVPGLGKAGQNQFYGAIAQELGVDWDCSTGYDAFIEAIWSGYFAPRVYALKEGNASCAQRQVDAAQGLRDMNVKHKEGGFALDYFYIECTRTFLQQEMDVLRHVHSPQAQESLAIAQQRVGYLASQLQDGTQINAEFERDPQSFYSLFFLPYMMK